MVTSDGWKVSSSMWEEGRAAWSDIIPRPFSDSSYNHRPRGLSHTLVSLHFKQGFGSGSGSVLDPYSIGPVDPDPYSEYGSGSRRAKMTHKSRKNSCFEVLDGLFCELQAFFVTWTYFMEA
jgi:hypothetical protein